MFLRLAIFGGDIGQSRAGIGGEGFNSGVDRVDLRAIYCDEGHKYVNSFLDLSEFVFVEHVRLIVADSHFSRDS